MTIAPGRIAEERVQIAVEDGTTMHAYVARPAIAAKPAVGFVVLQEAYGVTEWLRGVAARLADEFGAIAVAPDLYHRTGTLWAGDYTKPWEQTLPHVSKFTPEHIAIDAVAAHRWLLSEGVPAARTAPVGFCLGGLAAFVANARAPFGAAVSFYGGKLPESLGAAAAQHGPLLLLWGAKDTVAPPADRRAVIDALDAAGKTYTSVVFSTGHGFFRHAQPEVYDANASREAWAIMTAFLRNAGVIEAAS